MFSKVGSALLLDKTMRYCREIQEIVAVDSFSLRRKCRLKFIYNPLFLCRFPPQCKQTGARKPRSAKSHTKTQIIVRHSLWALISLGNDAIAVTGESMTRYFNIN